jgi:hypothetical protein
LGNGNGNGNGNGDSNGDAESGRLNRDWAESRSGAHAEKRVSPPKFAASAYVDKEGETCEHIGINFCARRLHNTEVVISDMLRVHYRSKDVAANSHTPQPVVLMHRMRFSKLLGSQNTTLSTFVNRSIIRS